MLQARVVVLCHFFSHYRKAVIDALMASRSFEFHFVGGMKEPFSSRFLAIVGWPAGRFTPTSLTPLKLRRSAVTKYGLEGGPLWQGGAIRAIMQPGVKAVIYEGVPYYLTTWLSAALARLTGKKVIFWTIGWMRKETGIKAIVRIAFYKLADAFLFYGVHGRQLAIEKGFKEERCAVICNSLDVGTLISLGEKSCDELGEALRKRLFGDPAVSVCICVSRLTGKRRLDLLFRALRLLSDAGTPMNCLLVGEGPERENLTGLAHELDVKVAFTGECYDEAALAEYYSAASVSVGPGFVGLACIQSLAFGVPVVTHNDPWRQCPEYEAITPHETGELFNAEDVADLARTLKNFAERPRPTHEVRKKCTDEVRVRFSAGYQRQAPWIRIIRCDV